MIYDNSNNNKGDRKTDSEGQTHRHTCTILGSVL